MSTSNSTPHLPEDYDLQVRRVIPYYDSMHLETINLVRSLRPSPRLWLDTGCGTGAMVERALVQMPDTSFILVDPSTTMLEQARSRLKGEERVRFLRPLRTQDLQDELDETPDLITAIQCHHYLTKVERERAVQICHDMLAWDGTFITFENVRPLTDAGIDIGLRNWGLFQSRYGRSQEEIGSHLKRFDKEYFPITFEEHIELLRGTGFRSVELLWYSYMQAGIYCRK